MKPQHELTPDETARTKEWADSLTGDPQSLPASFSYDGIPSSEIIPSWEVERSTSGSAHIVTYRDAKTGLEVRCVATVYSDFPTVEWTLYFKNTGDANTPILSDVRPLDGRFAIPKAHNCTLHHHKGSPCEAADYQPFTSAIGPNSRIRLATSGGRSSNATLPYFNLEWSPEVERRDSWAPETESDRESDAASGVIVVIGWPGQWDVAFARTDDGIAVCAGQELTHFCLHPGEEVRTQRIVLQFWEGSHMRSQNIWRQWMRSYNSPMSDGDAPAPHMAGCSSHQFAEMIKANEMNQKQFIDRYLDNGLKIDYWWMDAGWYVNKHGWPHTGTWEVDTKRFPNGLRAISDYANNRDVKTLLWFEPERVQPDTWLYDNHPEWLLGKDGEQKLLDLGNAGALQWLIDHVDRTLTEQGIGLYRQDFNMDPLSYWRENDAPDRQGITEIGHVTGLLEFWDELQRRHPGMLIDTCASGGRRNDIDALKRAIPLHRSDYIIEPTSQQCQTYGISFWIPSHGTGVKGEDAYSIRSTMTPHLNCVWDVRRDDLDFARLRVMIDQWRDFSPLYHGDYYPLTPYHLGNDVWMAWQFDRPDMNRGVIQAFRRPDSPYETARLSLHGLKDDQRYVVSDADTGEKTVANGRSLMSDGIHIALPNTPSSALLLYAAQT